MNDSAEIFEKCPGLNSDGSPAIKTYNSFNTIVNGYLTLFSVSVGILGNSYSIHLLRRQFNVRATISMYLRVLAIWDVLLLLCTFWYYSLEAALPNLGQVYREMFSYITVATHSISQISMTSSIWMSLVITSERYWAISKPLKHRAIDSTQRARFICLITAICSVIFNLPSFFELKVVYCSYGVNSTSVRAYADGTELRRSALYRLFYRAVGTLLFTTLVPFSSILLLTIRIIAIVRQQHKIQDWATAGHRYRKELYTTVMLLALATKFLICHCLPVIVNAMELKSMADNLLSNEPGVQRYLIDISNLLVVMNSATNWLIYSYWRKHFVTDILLRPFRRRKKITRDSSCVENEYLFAAPPLAAMSARQPYFTPEEAQVVQRIWMESLKFSEPPIGEKIIVSLVRKLPELASYFTAENVSFANNYQREVFLANLHFQPKIQSMGAILTDFLELVVFCIGDLRPEIRLTYYIRHVGQHHNAVGVQFTKEIWRELKNTLLDQTEQLDCIKFGNLHKFTLASMSIPSARIKSAWRKMVEYVIREMKQGSFMYVIREPECSNGDPVQNGSAVAV